MDTEETPKADPILSLSENGQYLMILRQDPEKPGVATNQSYAVAHEFTEDATLMLTVRSAVVNKEKRLVADITTMETLLSRLTKVPSVTEQTKVPAHDYKLWLFAEELEATKLACYLTPIGPKQVMSVN